MNITDFVGALRQGARPNLFEVRIGFLGDGIRFLAKATQLPPSVIGPIDAPYMGRMIKVPGNRTFEPWTITIYNDIDFGIKNAIESWMNQINGHEDNLGFGSTADAYKQGQVIQLGRDGAILRVYDIIDMFPTELSAIDLAFDSNDQIEEFTVTFQYNYWACVATS
jgi:hypothetical protein